MVQIEEAPQPLAASICWEYRLRPETENTGNTSGKRMEDKGEGSVC